ncbi:MAG: adenylate/guanylate cyclase domain-containing protein, partial [Alphaproteobacteria bacterium]|nr:adenylate/guanylate cyclase domain-containing protein [Alphaproteobacteria bacterium]
MVRWLQIALPFVVLFIAVITRVVSPEPFEILDLKTFDFYQQKSPRIYSEVIPGTDAPMPVKVIDIDDESLAQFGQWPWPRSLISQLIELLQRSGAVVIAFDVIFAEPDRTSPSRVIRTWPATPELDQIRPVIDRLPDHDRTLAETFKTIPIITGFVLTGGSPRHEPVAKTGFASIGDDPREFAQPVFTSAVTSLPELEAAATGNGTVNFLPDTDQIIRKVPMVLRHNNSLYPSLSAEALRVVQGAGTIIVKSTDSNSGRGFGELSGITEVKIGNVAVPTDPDGQFWIHHTGPEPRRMIPAWKILTADFDPADVAGKIIFVGASASALNDLRPSPVHPSTAGVEFHAQTIEQIISGQFLKRPDWAEAVTIVSALIAGILVIIVVMRLGAAWGGMVMISLLALGSVYAWKLFTEQGLLTAPLYPALTTTVVFVIASMTSYLQSESSRREVKGAFGRYMSPAVLDRLAKNPRKISLGGELRDMSILFCDVRNFTPISEALDAQALTGFVNSFLTPMTSAIHHHEGTVDKYMGDAVMAFWNAPLDDADHARHACHAALEMRKNLAELNQQIADSADGADDAFKLGTIRVGIGIGTGICCVGNMGSEQRFDYSVIGDNVNLTSRL